MANATEARETVNVTNILALRDFIRDSKFKFDMANEEANPACGTAGCIGGHAAVLWEDIRSDPDDQGGFTWSEEALASKLGISYRTEEVLCYMVNSGYAFWQVTKPVALAVLETLARTGKVDWDKGIEAQATMVSQ